MSNKLFCTFVKEDKLDSLLNSIEKNYKFSYNKIFVLYSKEQEEYICTYNVDLGNIATFPENTILVHRKKETNSLYTINALNALIRSLNNGVLNTSYRIEWTDYRNTILLTRGPELRKIQTQLHKVIEV